ncbi:MAG: hypothetical protein WA090_04605 [Candidatus Nanopelagicaceae bacterium]
MTPSPGRYVPDGPLDEGHPGQPLGCAPQDVAEVGATDRALALRRGYGIDED